MHPVQTRFYSLHAINNPIGVSITAAERRKTEPEHVIHRAIA